MHFKCIACWKTKGQGGVVQQGLVQDQGMLPGRSFTSHMLPFGD